jgi:hypothetical protein
MRQNRTGAVKRCRDGVARSARLSATFLGASAVSPKEDYPGSLEQTVFSCDYNGWADVPEEEREAIEAFEATLRVLRPSTVSPSIGRDSGVPPLRVPERRAA